MKIFFNSAACPGFTQMFLKSVLGATNLSNSSSILAMKAQNRSTSRHTARIWVLLMQVWSGREKTPLSHDWSTNHFYPKHQRCTVSSARYQQWVQCEGSHWGWLKGLMGQQLECLGHCLSECQHVDTHTETSLCEEFGQLGAGFKYRVLLQGDWWIDFFTRKAWDIVTSAVMKIY